MCRPLLPQESSRHEPSAWLPWNYPKAVKASALDHDPPGLPSPTFAFREALRAWFSVFPEGIGLFWRSAIAS